MFIVYVLECWIEKKKKFYVGFTEDFKKRLKKHQAGSVKSTKKYDKIKLVYYEACLNKTDSLKREKKLKTGFGRSYLKRRLENYLTNKRL